MKTVPIITFNYKYGTVCEYSGQAITFPLVPSSTPPRLGVCGGKTKRPAPIVPKGAIRRRLIGSKPLQRALIVTGEANEWCASIVPTKR